MVEPFPVPSGMAIAIEANPLLYHLCDGVFDGAVNGFFNFYAKTGGVKRYVIKFIKLI